MLWLRVGWPWDANGEEIVAPPACTMRGAGVTGATAE